jgi:hypothetical protein
MSPRHIVVASLIAIVLASGVALSARLRQIGTTARRSIMGRTFAAFREESK